MKAVYISRHKPLPVQEQAFKELGLEIIEQVPTLPQDPRELAKMVSEWKNKGVEVAITIALPPALLLNLYNACSRNGIRVYIIRMKALGVFSKEEAEKLVNEKPEARVMILDPRSGNARVTEFEGITELKKVEIVEEWIYKL